MTEHRAVLLFVACLLVACTPVQSASDDVGTAKLVAELLRVRDKPAEVDRTLGHVDAVSMTTLLSRPDDYDGRWLRVSGVLSTEFEGEALFADSDSYRFRVGENAIYVLENLTDPQALRHFEGRRVWLVGYFQASSGSRLFRNSPSFRYVAPMFVSNLQMGREER
jgi:hypothetical protein